MSQDPEPERLPEEDAATETVQQALNRAAGHARAAAAESAQCLHALLDAAALAANGEPAAATPLLAPLAQLLEAVSVGLGREEASRGGPLLDAVAEALDEEIRRWEARAREDGEARAVLRAFLGIRELLWELGVRRTDAAAEPGPAGHGRVQRVPVES